VAGRHAKFHVYSSAAVQALDSLGGERQTLEFLIGRLAPGDCLYDIGAATGLYTVFLAHVVGEKGRVVSFEPERDAYERLQENLKLNQLSNVQAFRLALSDREGSVVLQLGDVAGAARMVESCAERETRRVGAEHAQAAQGDEFVKAHGLPPPRAVKIDVEGHEYSVLRGLGRTLAQSCCELVCCEVHPSLLPRGLTPEDVLAFLRSVGFGRIEIHRRTKDFHAWAFKRN
jgi:FkbM family methyltransferase